VVVEGVYRYQTITGYEAGPQSNEATWRNITVKDRSHRMRFVAMRAAPNGTALRCAAPQPNESDVNTPSLFSVFD